MGRKQTGARRKRGIVLTAQGFQRLRQAIETVEAKEHDGHRYTLDELSSRVGVSTSTLSRLWSSQSGVDQRSVRRIFSALSIDLLATDFQKAGDLEESTEPIESTGSGSLYPSGPVQLGSKFYILRPPIETQACEEVARPGCVLRVKAPSGFGRSSLLLRVIDHAKQLGYAIATIDLRQADEATLADPEKFLRWFCVTCSLKLGLEPKLDDYWSDIVGNLLSTTLYLSDYLMSQIQKPLLLTIQEFNRMFAYTETSRAFLPLLRSWHEEARHNAVWQNLRLVVTYSTDSYLPLNINQSPFNVGLPLTLPEFTPAQVNALAELYDLSWTLAERDRLMALVGGHPMLIRIALYHLSQGDLPLDELLKTAPTQQGIYQDHLRRLFAAIRDKPKLIETLHPLINRNGPLPLELLRAYQLEGLGLIKMSSQGGWEMSCNLYREYCRNYLLEA